jgi:hypothetical protein
MWLSRIAWFASCLLALCAAELLPAADICLEAKEDRVTVTVDGQLFTEYIFKGYEKPILYPVNGPDGLGLTRNWPMRDSFADEAHDHPHHKSIWFGHMEVNGESFWHSGETAGTTVKKSLTVDGDTIHTQNDLVGRNGQLVARFTRHTIWCRSRFAIY